MRAGKKIGVVIPAYNEEPSIGNVLRDIPSWVDEVVLADNGSTDRTPEIAAAHGATVVSETRRGYGSACLAGIAALSPCEVVVFLDGDYSDHPDEMDRLVDPIVRDEADMVIGSRVLGRSEPGALLPQSRYGNLLACTLMRWIWKHAYTDLGPFRAIRATTLRSLGMKDPDYGWTVEMQIKALQKNCRIREVPVSYRRRIGRSKVSGTLRGVVGAGTKILLTIFRYALSPAPNPTREESLRQLIIFTRYPEPGKAKTRMIPRLGPEGAARLQRRMTELTISRALEYFGNSTASIQISYEGGDPDSLRQWLGSSLRYRSQGEGDLGGRLERAFRTAFESGMRRVIVIGSDCPGLQPRHLRDAFEALEQHRVALGPAKDGGYYLIGLRESLPELFENIPWSTDRVLEVTLRRIREKGLSHFLLEPLEDVDRPEDLHIWERESGPGTDFHVERGD